MTEKPAAPVHCSIHARRATRRRRKLCRAALSRGFRTVTPPEEVTCPRCLGRLANLVEAALR